MKLWSRIKEFNRRGRQRFYDGPAVYDYPGRRMVGYKSPNIMIVQWLHAFMATKFTLAGRLLFMFSCAIFLAGMTALEMPIYYLAFILVALFFMDLVVGWLVRPRVTIRRELPASGPANSDIRVAYTVTNTRKIPAWDIYVDTIPMPPPIAFVEGMAHLNRLRVGETATVANVLRVPRRGRYYLPMPVVDSAFPFGLWRWGCRGPSTGPLLIYPDFTSLAHVELPTGGNSRASGESIVAALAGDSMEFVGCREYRYGDSLRHIHAASWARRQVPVVKEFRDESRNRVSLLIDTFMPPPPIWRRYSREPIPRFEAAMSIAGAISEYMLRGQFEIDLFVPGEEDLHIPSGAGPDQLVDILEALASQSPNIRETFHACNEEQMAELHTATTVFVILIDWDEAREDLVRGLIQAGIGVRVLLVDEDIRILPDSPDAPLQLLPSSILGGHVTTI